jgi:hypothetical protein
VGASLGVFRFGGGGAVVSFVSLSFERIRAFITSHVVHRTVYLVVTSYQFCILVMLPLTFIPYLPHTLPLPTHNRQRLPQILCDYLYDDHRLRILHEQRLSALCEVCTVLRALMVLDGPSVISSVEAEDSLPTSPSRSDPESRELSSAMGHTGDKTGRGERGDGDKGLGELRISGLLRMVLQDAQTRLVFKAQSVMQSEIRWFVPWAGTEEVDWPGVLEREW